MNRELSLAIVFAAATLAWNLYGFAGNFFEHYWGGSGQPITFISYLANALLLAGIAWVGVKQVSATRTLALAGLVMAVWSLVGVASELAIVTGKVARAASAAPLNLPEPAPLIGALVPMITGAITAAMAVDGVPQKWSRPTSHYGVNLHQSRRAAIDRPCARPQRRWPEARRRETLTCRCAP